MVAYECKGWVIHYRKRIWTGGVGRDEWGVRGGEDEAGSEE